MNHRVAGSVRRCSRGLVLALCIGFAGQALAETPAILQLMENATYWQKKGRADRALEAWTKVLKSEPGHERALAEVALYHARTGNKEAANNALSELERRHPNSARLARVRRAVDVGQGYEALLTEARAHAKERRFEEAVATYRKAFGNKPPSDLAVEFYQTLGGTPSGWEEAREGLERLAAQHPGRPELKLAWGRHLTYRESGRRQGIRVLSELQEVPTVAARASKGLRQALVWLHAKPDDAPLYTAWLAVHPDDAELARKRDGLAKGRPDTSGQDLERAFTELEKGDRDSEAEGLLRRATQKRGKSASALVGLAVVAMRKDAFDEAVSLLEQAKELEPDNPAMWEKSLQSARFWSVMRKAEAAREADPKAATKLLHEAMALSPGEAWHAQLMLAHIHMKEEEWDTAEPLLMAALAAAPDDPGALAAAVRLYAITGRVELAEEHNARLAAKDEAAAVDMRPLAAEAQRREARALTEADRLEDALEVLHAAQQLDPKSPWLLLDMATVARELGHADEARVTLELLLTVAPGMTEAQLALAALHADGGRHGEALAVLEGLRQSALSTADLRRKRVLEVQVQVDRALRQAARGDRLAASRTLTEARRDARDLPQGLAAVALGWSEAGDTERAMAVMREALALSDAASLQLQLAAVLLGARRDRELLGVLNGLLGEAELSRRERRDLMSLRVALSVRRADELRERGRFGEALAQLSPLLGEYAREPRLLTALGRIYLSGGEYREARTLFQRVLEEDRDDLDAREGAISAAIALHDNDEARALAALGIERLPDDARMHLIAARMHVLLGQDASAMERLHEGLVLSDRLVGEDVTLLADAGGGGVGLSPESTPGEILRDAHQRFHPGGRSGVGVADGVSLRAQIETEMDRIRAKHNVEVGTELAIRHRAGEDGLSGIASEVTVPTWVSVPLGYTGRIGFEVTPVMLDAGPVGPFAWERFGTGGVQLDAAPEDPPGQTANGAALEVSYTYEGLRVWGGSTPLGFPAATGVGGISWRDQLGELGIALLGERAPVTQSLLSYAGATDPSTGVLWGAVLDHTARLDLAYVTDTSVYYVFGAFHYMLGTNVPDNMSGDGGVGAVFRIYGWEGAKVDIGINANAAGYQRNQGGFTYGHGGYFSPQIFVHGGLPFEWKGESGGFRWHLRAEPGLNWFKTEETAYYPTEPDVQARRVQLVETGATELAAVYPATEQLGFAFDLLPRIGYQILPELEAGLSGAWHTAPDYDEITGLLTLRYAFQRKTDRGLGANAPAPLPKLGD